MLDSEVDSNAHVDFSAFLGCSRGNPPRFNTKFIPPLVHIVGSEMRNEMSEVEVHMTLR